MDLPGPSGRVWAWSPKAAEHSTAAAAGRNLFNCIAVTSRKSLAGEHRPRGAILDRLRRRCLRRAAARILREEFLGHQGRVPQEALPYPAIERRKRVALLGVLHTFGNDFDAQFLGQGAD